MGEHRGLRNVASSALRCNGEDVISSFERIGGWFPKSVHLNRFVCFLFLNMVFGFLLLWKRVSLLDSSSLGLVYNSVFLFR